MHCLRREWRYIAVAITAATVVGLLAGASPPVVVAAASLLPVVSHVRWVGWRRAVSEPTAVTLILLFYLSVFPVRAAAIALTENGYFDVLFVRTLVTPNLLTKTLLLAALATTIFVEAYHRTRRSRTAKQPGLPLDVETEGTTVALAAVLGGLAMVGLAGILVQSGGVSGAIGVFAEHNKTSIDSAKSLFTSLWATFSVPAVWIAARLIALPRTAHDVRVVALAVSSVIVAAQIVVFSSRLSAILALTGAWVVWYLSGRRVPTSVVVIGIVALFVVSVPLLAARDENSAQNTESLTTRLTELAGYGILDISLAIRQDPTHIREQVQNPERWARLPAYLVPLWPDRPNIRRDRMDAFTVENFGAPNQQDSGFPTSFITETWLIGGVFWVAIVAATFGAAAGYLQRRVGDIARPSTAAVLCCAFAATIAFTYYKDGDLLGNTVGAWRTALYLGTVMLAVGAWSPDVRVAMRPGRRTTRRVA